jgi:2Fe-2S ferredoxin
MAGEVAVMTAHVTYVSHKGDEVELDGDAGESIMEIAVRNGLPGIVAECGGSMACSTCHVYVDEGDMDKLPPLSDMEDEMLYGTTEERLDNSRLSCQLKLGEGMCVRVTTPATQV